eukprot:355248-Chlamydomonas_euryale.AAC.2
MLHIGCLYYSPQRRSSLCRLQEGDMYCKSGSPSGTIKPEHVTDEVWDYVFLGKQLPSNCPISEQTLAKMRREFEYWCEQLVECLGVTSNPLVVRTFVH